MLAGEFAVALRIARPAASPVAVEIRPAGQARVGLQRKEMRIGRATRREPIRQFRKRDPVIIEVQVGEQQQVGVDRGKFVQNYRKRLALFGKIAQQKTGPFSAEVRVPCGNGDLFGL